MVESTKRLGPDEWGNHYNDTILKGLVSSLQHLTYNLQTNEMLKLTNTGDKVLEVGSGSGYTTLALAQNHRLVTALDYSERCLDLTRKAANQLNIKIETILADAEKELDFKDNNFDVIFQAGLLEHFTFDERVNLLKNWSRFGKKMISLIPNGSSIPYRLGKEKMEKDGTWSYGVENAIFTLSPEFNLAGFKVTQEYSIGIEEAINFLPSKHYLNFLFKRLINKNVLKNSNQGYLLVTIGEKCGLN